MKVQVGFWATRHFVNIVVFFTADIGYKGENCSAQLTGVNASIINPQGIWVGHYHQVR